MHQPAGLPAGAVPKPDVAKRSSIAHVARRAGPACRLHACSARGIWGVLSSDTHLPSLYPACRTSGWLAQPSLLPPRPPHRPAAHGRAARLLLPLWRLHWPWPCWRHERQCNDWRLLMGASVQTCCHSTVDTMLLLDANAPIRRSVATFVWKGNTNASMNFLARTFQQCDNVPVTKCTLCPAVRKRCSTFKLYARGAPGSGSVAAGGRHPLAGAPALACCCGL